MATPRNQVNTQLKDIQTFAKKILTQIMTGAMNDKAK